MGYPVYKLLRAVNRQYPNNGFINYTDVTETIYDSEEEEDKIISEDLRDLINEALSETYIYIAKDEVYTIPTVAGQREYALPEDCDLRDIQEVVRQGNGICPPGGKYYEEWFPFGPRSDRREGNPQGYGWRGELEGSPIYPGWLPNFYGGSARGVRLTWARDAEECTTGNRYYNAWDNKRIGIFPTPKSNFEAITIYYKKRPKEVLYIDDEIEVREKFLPLLKYAVCAKLAMSGSNPDIDMYNVFIQQYNTLVLEAKRDKDSDQPYYQHVKDNMRSSSYFRRRGLRRGGLRRW